jgi:hypothetical protein
VAQAQDGSPLISRVGATALAESGIAIARRDVGPYSPMIWAAPGFRRHGHDGSHHGVLRAWIYEQLVAVHGRGPSHCAGYRADAGGVYGFGLSYHLGYGYGGYGIGVGPEGGSPFYGGPGYRYGGVPYDGGPLSHGEAVAATVEGGPVRIPGPGPVGRAGYGPFTGASSYPFLHRSSTDRAAAAGMVEDPFGGAGTSEVRPPRSNGNRNE